MKTAGENVRGGTTGFEASAEDRMVSAFRDRVFVGDARVSVPSADDKTVTALELGL